MQISNVFIVGASFIANRVRATQTAASHAEENRFSPSKSRLDVTHDGMIN